MSEPSGVPSLSDFAENVVKPAVSPDTTVKVVPVATAALQKAARKYSKTFQVPEDIAIVKLQNDPQLLAEWLKH